MLLHFLHNFKAHTLPRGARFQHNSTSFMSTEFSEVTLLRNILCMSTNKNQEHMINCIKENSTELLAEKW